VISIFLNKNLRRMFQLRKIPRFPFLRKIWPHCVKFLDPSLCIYILLIHEMRCVYVQEMMCKCIVRLNVFQRESIVILSYLHIVIHGRNSCAKYIVRLNVFHLKRMENVALTILAIAVVVVMIQCVILHNNEIITMYVKLLTNGY
jgi:hypothetical protein